MMQRFWLCLLLLGSLGWAAPSVAVQPASFDLTAALAAAQPGDTLYLPAGVYHGPLIIDKPITLQGEAGAVIDGGGQGDVVIIRATQVSLRNLTIRNSGDSLDREHAGVVAEAGEVWLENNRLEDVLFGIYLKNAPHSRLQKNVIRLKAIDVARRGDAIKIWYSTHCLVEGNQVYHGRDLLIWYSSPCVVRDNLVEYSRYGLHVMNSDHQELTGNILRHNSVGLYVMYGREIVVHNNVLYDNRGPSGFGIGLKDAVNVAALGNRLVSNRVGLYVDNSPPEPNAEVRFEQNLFAYNDMGVELLPLVKRNIYLKNIFLENSTQVVIAGGGDASGNQWSVADRGNYWSDYVGFDADGDAVGDLPYRSLSLFENLLEQHPALRLFQLSPASEALDLAARAFPIFQPKPKLADEHPLMAPPDLPVVAGLPIPPMAANLAVASGLITVALLILASVWRTPFYRSD
jgi:nitrous oxidase accessory protein